MDLPGEEKEGNGWTALSTTMSTIIVTTKIIHSINKTTYFN